MEVLRIALAIGAGICMAGAVYWLVALVRIGRELIRLARAEDGLALPEPTGGWPAVSVIVPAHNEQQLAPACARALLASDYPRLQAIFVLDRCTDGTEAALRPIADADPRLRIVVNGSCPPDWAGKCNAARLGAEHADGELLLFTDADTEFDPRLVRATAALLRHRALSLLSLLPTLTAERFFERVSQPVAGLTLLRMYPISSANRPSNPRVFANGQFLLFERTVYEGLGGHAAVKDDLLEDIAFARAVRDRAGGRCGLFVAGPLLVVRMYESLAAFVEGWKRIYIEACLRSPARLRRKAIEVLLLGIVQPAFELLTLVGGIAALAFADRGRAASEAAISSASAADGTNGSSSSMLAAIASWAIVLALLSFVERTAALFVCYRQSSSPAAGVFFYPLGSWHVFKSLWGGARDLDRRRPVRWGGREYVL
ncbi:MAG: glycosyltransferase, partial [Phycisphaerae bacterium]|nr:glycosyltransferase [Phycisphaerae bacterium]